MILNEVKIRQLLAKPKNESDLLKALAHQKELKQYYENAHPELIYEYTEKLLTPQKQDKFKVVFENHPQTLIDKIEKHYSKVFEADGRKFSFDFGKDINTEVKFNEIRNSQYSGLSDEDFFRKKAISIALTEPSSVYHTGKNEAGLPFTRHITLDSIFDIEESLSRIEYLIVKKEVDNKKKYFFVIDDIQMTVWLQTESGFEQAVFISEDGMQITGGLHGNTKCPVSWAFNSCSGIVKNSILSDSCKDMKEYSVMRTFYMNYKMFSAFGTNVKAETRCDYQDEQVNVRCQSGILQPLDPEKSMRVSHNETECPSCKSRNSGVMGENIVIPITQQSDEGFISNFQKLNYRIEAETSILEFHHTDVDKLKDEIIGDLIGEGFGQSYRSQAINEDQVGMNFDTQETNLDSFRYIIQDVWQFNATMAAELFQPLSFVSSTVILGDKYFLKTLEQLYAELESLQNVTSNTSSLEDKHLEIVITENKHSPKKVDRYKIIKALKPLANFPLTYVKENRAVLNKEQVRIYENFDQALSFYEMENGQIEDIIANVIGPISKSKKAKEISESIKEIIEEIVPEVEEVEEFGNRQSQKLNFNKDE